MQLSKSNRATLKIILLVIASIILLWLICYKYVSNIPFQIGYLIVANIIYATIFKPKNNLQLWRIWYKKMIFLLVVNILFAYLDIQFHLYDKLSHQIDKSIDFYHKMDHIEYHKQSIARIFLTLMNTILTLDCIIKLISFADLILLPISIETKKKIIFYKSIFNFLTEKIKLNDVVTDTIPEYQFYSKRNKFIDFKFLFKRNLISIFTMLKLVTEQSSILGQLIDNKIHHSSANKNGDKN
jgi:cell division protein ZapA (FtsZ GTPase activity inhibitor)